MPKSAMMVSEDGSLVRKRVFSGLSKYYTSHPKTLARKKGGVTYLRSRWTMSLLCNYFTPDNGTKKRDIVFSLACGMR